MDKQAATMGLLIYAAIAILLPVVFNITLVGAYGASTATTIAIVSAVLLVAAALIGLKLRGFAFFELFGKWFDNLTQSDGKGS